MICKKYNLLHKMLFLGFISIALLACLKNKKAKAPTDLTKMPIIPQVVLMEATGGVFELPKEVKVYTFAGDSTLANYLVDMLKPSTGIDFEIVILGDDVPSPGSISLVLSTQTLEMGKEGYVLEVTEDKIEVKSFGKEGIFYGIQTLRQLLPPKIERQAKQDGPWEIPTGKIHDAPNYAFRGAMLDVSRHFFDVEDVKRYIDFLAYYKMNTLHLHLSDDQGWRIEINSWPKLATYGGSTQVGGGAGGYYTQEEYRKIVDYAADRYITIIPEIDMPGHTNAALASYPELNCDNKAPELYTGTEVGFSTLCTDKEVVYQFVDDVIQELVALTPGPYIHIGGDESKVTKLKDFKAFISTVQKIVKKHGKQMIGWEEAVQAELEDDAIIQYWANADHAKEAAEKGLKLIMSPAKKAYLDMQYDSTTHLGLHWAGYIEVDDAYNWNPRNPNA